MKMLKLLQELRGFSAITDRRPSARHPALAAMPIRPRTRGPGAIKRFITIQMQDPIDIPSEVTIRHIAPARSRATASPGT